MLSLLPMLQKHHLVGNPDKSSEILAQHLWGEEGLVTASRGYGSQSFSDFYVHMRSLQDLEKIQTLSRGSEQLTPPCKDFLSLGIEGQGGNGCLSGCHFQGPAVFPSFGWKRGKYHQQVGCYHLLCTLASTVIRDPHDDSNVRTLQFSTSLSTGEKEKPAKNQQLLATLIRRLMKAMKQRWKNTSHRPLPDASILILDFLAFRTPDHLKNENVFT
nr:uncharacterized protein LOC103888895 [Pongo abelii]